MKNNAENIQLHATKRISETRAAYGNHGDNFAMGASPWSMYLDKLLSAKDVALMMVLFKVARARRDNDPDHATDIAGYGATLTECH